MHAKRVRLFGLGSVLSLLLVFVTQVNPAAAAVVGCGHLVLGSVTLTADVGPCPGNGLIIGANSVTVDLGGHRVRGAGNRTDDRIGIVLSGRHGVTVTDGTVAGFAAGIVIKGGSANTVSRLTVRDNIGPALRQADFGDGIVIDGSSANRVLASVIGPNNGPFDGVAVIDAGANFNRIAQNLINGNNVDAPLSPGGPSPFNFDEGIFLTPSTIQDNLTGNVIEANVIRANGANGIDVFESVQNSTIRSNDIEANGFGAAAALNGGVSGVGLETEGVFFNAGAGTSTIERNVVRGNSDGGIVLATCCGGPLSQEGGHNRVLNNLATGNQAFQQFTDLYDSFAYSNSPPGGCGTDVWQGNIWGFYPSTSLGSFFADCTTSGGAGPRPGVFSGAAATAARSGSARAAIARLATAQASTARSS